MADRELVANLRYVHGAYNTAVMAMFYYMLSLGLRIRRNRKSGSPDPVPIKRHRKTGPVLVPLGIAGFFAGLAVVYIDEGHVYEYPLHFLNGLAISLLLIATFAVSRGIRGAAPVYRKTHMAIGIVILCLYAVQAFLGLGVLL